MSYLFTPPGTERPVGADRLWARFSVPVSFTLLKKDGFYTLTETPDDSEVAAADVAYLSGHQYTVSDTEATALTQAGYGASLSALPTPNPTNQGTYGYGAYGSGTYGG